MKYFVLYFLLCSLGVVVIAGNVQGDEQSTDFQKEIDAATANYVATLKNLKQQAADTLDEKTVKAIDARIKGVQKPSILGNWSWYHGVMTVNADGTCHWKGPNKEEHGVWTKASDYLFNWGEKNNDWNYLNVDDEGKLSGKFIIWKGGLQGERPSE
ncbi:MAG: hypothetical protein WBF93_21975 [Pirellulales bacterium]|nr:hypothetical protein [Pirellulales bacterium]